MYYASSVRAAFWAFAAKSDVHRPHLIRARIPPWRQQVAPPVPRIVPPCNRSPAERSTRNPGPAERPEHTSSEQPASHATCGARQRRARTSWRAALRRARRRGEPRRRHQHGKAARAGGGPGRAGGRASKAGRKIAAAVGWKKRAGAANPTQMHLRRPRRRPRTSSVCSPMRRRRRCVLLGGRRCSKNTRANQAAPPMSAAACAELGKF